MPHIPSDVANRATAVLTNLLSQPVEPGLHIVATPIGNLGDITLRALAVLARADVIYAENPNHSRRLLGHYAITVVPRTYHEHNAPRERPAILEELAMGKTIALISDAGTPLVSDPGYKLVRECLDRGLPVTCIPGASAPIAALVMSGLPTDTFFFVGFLPTRASARTTRLQEVADIRATLIFFESPNRISRSLTEIAEALGDRQAAVVREITKLNEETKRGPAVQLAKEFQQRSSIKGELVILVAPPRTLTAPPSEEVIQKRLDALLQTMSLRDATRHVSAEFGLPRKKVYDVGLSRPRTDGLDDEA